jgi:hypothetical protein
MSTPATEPPIITNPFTYGRPILDPKRFCGRAEEVHRIFTCLKKPESVSIVGERRIGKTSLLKYIADPDIRKEAGLRPEESAFVFVDFQELPSTATPADFWAGVLRDVGRQIGDTELRSEIERAIVERPLGTQEVGRLLDNVTKQGRKVVLLLDELENTTQQPHFGRDFFDGLHHLASLRGLILVTASYRDLVELGHTIEIVSSPFFNIFSVVRLSCFTEEEAAELVRKYLGMANVGFDFEPDEKELALRFSSGFPCFFQMACCALFEAHVRGYSLPERLSFARDFLVEQMAGHFEYYWRRSSPEEQRSLQALVMLQSETKDGVLPEWGISAGATLSLEKRNLVIREQDEARLFSPLFGKWIMESPIAGTRELIVEAQQRIEAERLAEAQRIAEEERRAREAQFEAELREEAERLGEAQRVEDQRRLERERQRARRSDQITYSVMAVAVLFGITLIVLWLTSAHLAVVVAVGVTALVATLFGLVYGLVQSRSKRHHE